MKTGGAYVTNQPLQRKSVFTENALIGLKTPNLDLYMEKVHIFERNLLKEILIVIFKNKMNFIYLEKDIFFMRPINIVNGIESILKCTMSKSTNKNEKAAGYQYISIKLDGGDIKTDKRKHSHVNII